METSPEPFWKTMQQSKEAVLEVLQRLTEAHEHELALFNLQWRSEGSLTARAPLEQYGNGRGSSKGAPAPPDSDPAQLARETSPSASLVATTPGSAQRIASVPFSSIMPMVPMPGALADITEGTMPAVPPTSGSWHKADSMEEVPGLDEESLTMGATSSETWRCSTSGGVDLQRGPATSPQPSPARESFLAIPGKHTGSAIFNGGARTRSGASCGSERDERNSTSSCATAITVFNNCRDDPEDTGPLQPTMARVNSIDEETSECYVVAETWLTRGKSGSKNPRSQNNKPSRLQSQNSSIDEDWDDEYEKSLGGRINLAARRVMMSPTNLCMLTWEICAICMVAWDTWMLPMDYAFSPSARGPLVFGQWVTRLYWTLDLFVTSFTGYVDDEGRREMRFTKVLKHYARTWMVIDVFLVACDWFTELFSASAYLSVSQLLRSARLLKLLRMIRIMQMTPDLASRLIKFRSSGQRLSFVGGLVKLFVCTGVTLHLIACGWFGLSKYMGSGWIYDVEVTCADGVLCRVRDAGFRMQYAMSYHWSITQVIGSADVAPSTAQERIYAILVLFLSLFISATVVSSITTAMTQLQIITAEKSTALMKLQQYMTDRGISGKLAMRVQKNAAFVLEEMRKNVQEDRVEVLKHISEPLHIELHWEMNGWVLMWHPFFKDYSTMNDYAIHQICHHAVGHLTVHKGDVLFTPGEQKEAPEMHFVKAGKLLYFRNADSCVLAEGRWAGEPTIWISNWSHVGKLQAVEQTNLLCLNAHKTQKIANQFKSINFWPAVYAQEYCARLNKVRRDLLTDVDDDTIIDTQAVADKIFYGIDTGPAGKLVDAAGEKRRSGMGGRLSALVKGSNRLSALAGSHRLSALRGGNKRTSAARSPRSSDQDDIDDRHIETSKERDEPPVFSLSRKTPPDTPKEKAPVAESGVAKSGGLRFAQEEDD